MTEEQINKLRECFADKLQRGWAYSRLSLLDKRELVHTDEHLRSTAIAYFCYGVLTGLVLAGIGVIFLAWIGGR